MLDTSNLVVEDREGVYSAAKACVLELEGQGVKYNPVFGNEFRQVVGELLASAERANEAASDMLKEIGASKGKVESEGTLVGLVQWMLGGGVGSQDTQEVEELRKTVQHLTASLASLTEVFSLAVPKTNGVDGVRKVVRGNNQPEMEESENGLVLTPHGRWQVVQGLAKPIIRYEGDPDLSPITHGEVVWLVRALYQSSLWLNNRWGFALHSAWGRGGVWGRAAKLVLAPPQHYYTVVKSISGGPNTRQLHRHNARISLRPLASKKVLLYIFVFCALLKLFGYSITTSLSILLFLASVFLLITASFQYITQPTPSLLETSDLVLGDVDDKKIN